MSPKYSFTFDGRFIYCILKLVSTLIIEKKEALYFHIIIVRLNYAWKVSILFFKNAVLSSVETFCHSKMDINKDSLWNPYRKAFQWMLLNLNPVFILFLISSYAIREIIQFSAICVKENVHFHLKYWGILQWLRQKMSFFKFSS